MAGGGFDVLYSKMDDFIPKIQKVLGNNLEALRVIPLPLRQRCTPEDEYHASEPGVPKRLEVYEILEALATPLSAFESSTPLLLQMTDGHAASLRSVHDEEQDRISPKALNNSTQLRRTNVYPARASSTCLDSDAHGFGVERAEGTLLSPSKIAAREDGASLAEIHAGDKSTGDPHASGGLKRKFDETECLGFSFGSNEPTFAAASSSNGQKRGRLEADGTAVPLPTEQESDALAGKSTAFPQVPKATRTVTFACDDSDGSASVISRTGQDNVTTDHEKEDTAHGTYVAEKKEMFSVLDDFPSMNIDLPIMIDPVFRRKPLPAKKPTLKVQLLLMFRSRLNAEY